MKRFISILLALLMCASALGGAVIAGAEEAGQAIYKIVKPADAELTADVWDSALAATNANIKGTIVPLIGYGNHGFKYWTSDENTYNAALNYIRSLQLTAGDKGYLRMYSYYSANGVSTTHCETGIKIALAFKKPSTVPSFYRINVTRSGGDANAAEVYTSPLDENNKDIAYYTSDAAKNGSTYDMKSSSSHDLNEVIYNNGTDDHVIAFFTGVDKNLQLGTITFNPVAVKTLQLISNELDILTGETTKIGIRATLDDGKNTGLRVNDAYVTYDSSDKSVATIAADGKVTAHKNGKTTLTASVAGETFTTTLNVGVKSYIFTKPSSLTEDIWDSTLAASSNMKGTFMPLIGYGSHGYKFWDADEYTKTVSVVKNVRALQYSTCIRIWSKGSNSTAETFANPDGVKAALALKAPRKGFYSVAHTAGSSDGGAQVADFHISHISAEDEAAKTKPVTDFINPESRLRTGTIGSTGEYKYGKIIAPNGVDNLIYAVSLDPTGTISIAKLSFTELDVKDVTVRADSATLKPEETTKVVTKTDAGDIIADTFIEYTSDNTSVATVAKDGTVKAIGEGEAIITAKVNGFASSVRITVEPEKVEDATTSDTVSFAADANIDADVSVSGIDYNGSIDSATRGETVTVKAPEVDGYKFRYWVRGSATNGKWISSDAEYTFRLMTNTMLTAVYDKVAESDALQVEFWNQNGAYIATKTVENGAVDAPEAKLTGYTFRNWFVSDDEMLDVTKLTAPITRAVAKFAANAVAGSVTIGGEAVSDIEYNKEITKTVPGAKVWYRDGKAVAYGESYTYYVWDATAITYATEEVEKAPLVVLEEGNGAYMIEYDAGDKTIIEAGIVFGENATVDSCAGKATSQKNASHGQFTAESNGSTTARGYIIYRDGTDYKVKYSD